MKHEQLKNEVRDYWNRASCGTEVTHKEKFSGEYFQEIENYRYRIEPEIMAFAQFSRFHDKKVLEVGVGAGTDFMQWVRSGAHASGVDLTNEAIENVTYRLAFEGLQAHSLQVADAEALPFADNQFDLVYSWGVIHHSPNTEQCLKEIVRVAKPGAHIKIMIYHRFSLFSYYQWLRSALLKGKPFQSLSRVLYYHQESISTKAYSFKEAQRMIAKYSVDLVSIKAPVTQHDLLFYKSGMWRLLAYCTACILGWNRSGWFMMIELKKRTIE